MEGNTPINPEPPQPPNYPTAEPARRWLPLAIIAAAIVIAAALVSAALIMSRDNHTPAQSSGPSVEPSSINMPTEPSSINTKCNASTVPLVTLDSQADGEPTLALPQPSGWVFNTELNSSLIRAVMGDPELRANNFTPDTAVTLENTTDQVSTPQQALDGERAGLINTNIGSHYTDTPSTTCGYPSTTITYTVTLNGNAATALVVAAQDSSNRVWAATVTIQTNEPDNPDYINAKHAILDGFQFSLPGDH